MHIHEFSWCLMQNIIIGNLSALKLVQFNKFVDNITILMHYFI